MRFIPCVLTLALFSSACSSSDDQFAIDQAAILTEFSVDVVTPALAELEAKTKLMSEALTTLCAEPSDATEAAAKAAWVAARTPLKRAEVFGLGPWESSNIGDNLDFWPLRSNNIESAINGATNYDEAYLGNLGVSAKGFPAIEYLLYQSDLTTDSQRCAYTDAIGKDALRYTTQLRTEWATYGPELAQTGHDGVSMLVNELIFASEFVVSMKLSKPLGYTTGTPNPDGVESLFSSNSLAEIEANLDAIEAAYAVLAEVVERRNGGVHAQLVEHFAAARTALAAVEGPLDDAIRDRPDVVEALRAAVKDVQRDFSTNVAITLGVALTFNDNDGD